MGESYSQGIEKAARHLRGEVAEATHPWDELTLIDQTKYQRQARAAVEAFLSAQPTIQWCEVHEAGGSISLKGHCRNWPYQQGVITTCRFDEVRIVDRETP